MCSRWHIWSTHSAVLSISVGQIVIDVFSPLVLLEILINVSGDQDKLFVDVTRSKTNPFIKWTPGVWNWLIY